MAKRIIWGLIMGVGFGFTILQSLPWVMLIFAGIHIIAQHEYCQLVRGLYPTLRWLHILVSTVAWAVLCLVLTGHFAWQLALLAPMAIVLIYLPFMLMEYERKGPAEHYLKLLRSFLLITLPLSFMPIICVWPGAMPLILLLFGASWVADSGALFTGKLTGRTKLAPSLSPKKTTEGAFGGMICAGVAWVVVGIIYPRSDELYFANMVDSTTAYLLLMFLIGMVLAVIGMMGDLAFSLFKREAEIKDYSAFLPAHGGILDRFDSMIFVAPALYVVASGLIGL